uniref:tRNA-guanine(15) transglycosylase-like domain-containing protein n=1 Tax=Meloidogyne enterolobii TaxID=390850 RepID=A0A6V7XYI6_MELEN|nr:unnamed protein product [Meloidogyne enterolobii]
MFGNCKSFRNPSISFIGRVGQIKQECSPSTSNYLCSTPNTMLYTRGGHIPHLTWDLFDNHIAACVEHKRLLIQISLQNIFDSLEVIKLSGGIKNFYRFEPDHFLHLSLLDPLSARDVVSNRFIHFWSRGGRKKMDMEQFKNAIEAIIPNSFQAPFDFDTPIDCCNKKLQKCLKRSRSFFEALKINSEDNNCFDKRTIFSIGGGPSIFHRKMFVKELLLQLCPDNIEVINLDLFLWSKIGNKKEENFDKEFLRQLIAETLSYLPQNNLRIVEGPFDPSQVLFLFKQGVDLFDSSYPTFLAEKGFAFELLEGFPLDDNNEQFSLIDLNEKKYLNEHKTLFPNCGCYTCKLGNGYTRAYIGHLLLCKEMFGYTLLMLHNIYEWLRMFSLLKMSIMDETSFSPTKLLDDSSFVGPSSISIGKQITFQEKRHRILYGVSRDDYLTAFAADKKRLKLEKSSKDGKRKETNAPSLDRIPMPNLPENVKVEYRASMKDAQQRKYRISHENPPSVCLYTLLNSQGDGGLCSATISDNASLLALGYGSSNIQVNALATENLRMLKEAKELEELDNEMEEFSEEMFDEKNKQKSFTLLGHSGPVHSLSFSCEKRLLLSASRDATIRLWGLEMQRNLVIYRPMAPVWKAIFCNRGYYFAASTADQCVSLWATDRVKPLRIFADAKDDVTELEFHPNCNYIIGGGDNALIHIWDVLTGTCVRTLSDQIVADRGTIRGLKSSPCGRYLVAAYEAGTIGVWDLAQQRLLLTYDCEDTFDFNTPIQFSRDASIVAIGTPQHGLSFFSMEVASSAAHSSSQQQMPHPMYI